jgi:hypothetical protein
MHDEPHEMPQRQREVPERIDPRIFERLVDDALSPEEYRQVLAALDEQPGAWRQCALAFLEAQALQRDLGRLLDESLATSPHARRYASADCPSSRTDGDVPPTVLRSSDDAPGKPSERERSSAKIVQKFAPAWAVVGQWMSLAACLLLGLAAGLWAPWRPAPSTGQPASGLPSMPPLAASSPERVAPDRPPGRAWGTVQLVAEADRPDPQQVPVYELPALEDPTAVQRWLAETSPLAGELEELLRRGGFTVQREQHLLAAPLEDGRQAIVPVEGYYLQPARWTY